MFGKPKYTTKDQKRQEKVLKS